MKNLIATILFALAATSAAAQTALPSMAQVDAAMRRTFGYDPAITWQILDISPSAAPGLTEVVVSMNKQAPTRLYLTPDGRQAIVGDMMPFGPDPYAPARAALAAARGPTRGASAMSIVVFSDFNCPHCKATQPVLDRLAQDFPQVRQTFVQFPLPASLHPWARTAALWADCVGRAAPAGFWTFADKVFAAQGEINAANAEAKLAEIARSSGLDAPALAACAASPAAAAGVDGSLALGRKLGVDSVPSMFVNGRKVIGPAALPYDDLKRLVQFELDHAGR